MSKHTSAVKDRPLYKALRNEGIGKKKAVRVANAIGNGSTTKPTTGNSSKRTRRSVDYENRTKTELLDRARKNKISGRSAMSKNQLIKALRRH